MSPDTISNIAYLILVTAVMVGMWDIENMWKRLFLYLVILVSILGLRFAEYDDGYHDGINDSVCIYNEIPGDCK